MQRQAVTRAASLLERSDVCDTRVMASKKRAGRLPHATVREHMSDAEKHLAKAVESLSYARNTLASLVPPSMVPLDDRTLTRFLEGAERDARAIAFAVRERIP